LVPDRRTTGFDPISLARWRFGKKRAGICPGGGSLGFFGVALRGGLAGVVVVRVEVGFGVVVRFARVVVVPLGVVEFVEVAGVVVVVVAVAVGGVTWPTADVLAGEGLFEPPHPATSAPIRTAARRERFMPPRTSPIGGRHPHAQQRHADRVISLDD
jgi:hypothetical protein